MIKLRPHAIGNLMNEPRSKSAKDAGEMSETAKTYCTKLAKESIYGYRDSIKSKAIDKGLQCENDSIDLLNIVTGNFYSKNELRVETDLLSGEADIIDSDCVIDIKTAWSLSTFPVLPEDARSDIYEYQLRAYMHLYDKSHATLAYCLVSTPESLCAYEDFSLHLVDHIPHGMRVTLWHCKRDLEIEERMLDKCRKAQAYIIEQIKRIKDAHNF